MNPKRIFSVILLAVIATSLIMPAPSAHSQAKKSQGGTTPAPPTTKTKLEVQEFGGEFQQWVKSLTITSAEKVTFRWMSDQPGVASAVWQVSDKPLAFGDNITQAQAPNVIASGVLGSVPKPGHVAMFDIDFAQFAPKTPPSTPRSYWVFVKTINAAQQFAGLPSASVKVTYRKSAQKPVDFSSIPGQKPKPMPIQIHLSKFTVNKTNEGQGDDDPYLFVVAIYADGTTVKPLDLAHSSVRLQSPTKTHNNLLMDAYDDEPKSGKSYQVPISIGNFETGILPLSAGGLLSLEQARSLSRVGVLVIVMDEDNTETGTANTGRKALVNNLQKELDSAIQNMKTPDIEALTKKLKGKVESAMKEATLKNWWAPWGFFDAVDPDDFIGSNFATFSYAQILDAGTNGLPLSLVCESDDGSYTITGTIRKR